MRMIDPPDGRLYGFPKPIAEPLDGRDLDEWLIANGYPEEKVAEWPGGVPCFVYNVEDLREGDVALGDISRGTRSLLQLAEEEFEAIVGTDRKQVPFRTYDLARIARALAILLPVPSGPSEWIRTSNDHPVFGGRAALDLLLDDQSSLLRIRQYLDAELQR